MRYSYFARQSKTERQKLRLRAVWSMSTQPYQLKELA